MVRYLTGLGIDMIYTCPHYYRKEKCDKFEEDYEGDYDEVEEIKGKNKKWKQIEQK